MARPFGTVHFALFSLLLFSSLSSCQLFVTLWTVAHQAPLSMGFSRQEYWSGLPCPSPGHLPNPGIKLECSAWQRLFTTEPAGKSFIHCTDYNLIINTLQGGQTPKELSGDQLPFFFSASLLLCRFRSWFHHLSLSLSPPCSALSQSHPSAPL